MNQQPGYGPQGQQPGYGPPMGAKPPKKTNPLLIVAAVLGGLFLIGLVNRSQKPAESATSACAKPLCTR